MRDVYRSLSEPGSLASKRRYLDIGAGNGVVSAHFGSDFEEIYALDIKPANWQLSELYNAARQVHRIVATADALPFSRSQFELVSMFSMLEYPRNQHRAVEEAIAVLRPGGELFIQVLNRHFLAQLHTGLPNPYYLPRFIRDPLLRFLGYGWLLEYKPPSRKDLERILSSFGRAVAQYKIRPLVWPPALVPRPLRWLYVMLNFIGAFRIWPPAYVVWCRKPQEEKSE
jgi:SAM-dependent methyltransferase